MSININQFRNALSTFATGITVVTAKDAANNPIGITVNSFSSVSLEPPLILWSLAKGTKEYDHFMQASHYCINILTAKQKALSEQFANPYHDKFANIKIEQGLNGIIKISDCLSHFECSHWQHYEGGDHIIIVGKVEQFARNESDPLIFYNSRYETL